MKNAVDQAFGGDVYLAVEQYYSNVSNVLEKFPADIIGHIDLITKFNEIEPYIDVNNPRYIKAWQTAVDKLIPYNKPFEINTGAISRGYRTTPYPAPDILAYIKQKGGFYGLEARQAPLFALCDGLGLSGGRRLFSLCA